MCLEDLAISKGVTAASCIAIFLAIYLFLLSNVSKGIRIPKYVLLEGYAIAQLLMGASWLNKLANSLLRHGPSALYGFTSTHRVLSSPSLATTILRRPHAILNNDPAQWALTVRVFGSREHTRAELEPLFESLFGAVSKHLLQESHARSLIQNTYSLLCSLVPTFTTISTSAPWLVNANPHPNRDGSISLDLYPAIRDFTTYVSTRMLAGSDFQSTYPSFPTDLFALDSAFTLLALGLPTWTALPLVRNAIAARKRLLSQLEAFAERIEAAATGTATSELQDRLKDVNDVFWDRSGIYHKAGLPLVDRASADLGLFWALNANTSPFVFWVVARLYADASLLARVREEIDPFVIVTKNADGTQNGAPFVVDSLDAEAILTRAPLLKATYLETFRLAHEPTSLRYVADDFSISDPSRPKDAPPLSFRKGTFLTVPHIVQQYDPAIYPDPNEFQPERFLSEENGKLKAGSGSLKPWGEGGGMCKGRMFAEREVLVAVTLVVRFWDVEADGGELRMPGKIPGTGVVRPKSGLRVKMRARMGM
ncbi:hypothetical protein MMC10_000653 [Thelotrema lepadinum]|nr:hypothetical protein [Thelotrema lepadinum]